MPPKRDAHVGSVRLTTDQIRERMLGSRKRHQEETRRARAKEAEQVMMASAERERAYGRDPITYIGTVFISLIFLALPLGEARVDWSMAGALLVLFIAWNTFFHQHTKMHYLLFFLINVLVALFSDTFFTRFPEFVASISLFSISIIALVNVAFNFLFYRIYRRRALTKTEYLDWVTSGHIIVNAVLIFSLCFSWRELYDRVVYFISRSA